MDSKIIKFDKNYKKRKQKRYELKAQISVKLTKNAQKYTNEWFSPNNISEEDIFNILKKIFILLEKEIPIIEYKKYDKYAVEFSLLYYEKGMEDIKYICNPPNIPKEKLLEYIWISLNIYQLKKTGAP